MPEPLVKSSMDVALEALGGKWKLLLLKLLGPGPLRPSELRRAVPGLSERVLMRQLRGLEADGLVGRVVYPEVPPRVEYELTEHGRSVGPLIEALSAWGLEHATTVLRARGVEVVVRRLPLSEALPPARASKASTG